MASAMSPRILLARSAGAPLRQLNLLPRDICNWNRPKRPLMGNLHVTAKYHLCRLIAFWPDDMKKAKARQFWKCSRLLKSRDQRVNYRQTHLQTSNQFDNTIVITFVTQSIATPNANKELHQ
ncbi:hypothetical protein I7I51_05089 [Histoplasma capsulatum]|uniref:Uncharacterized protein n=1 Tax=Ajellomyces capsulatus TaxID=5037 RepID=A0A8A1M745_AJECA|nr:hypothetical protein I7I51_05089 [Histoplasma capsulatum]